jgi:hypothetical protein
MPLDRLEGKPRQTITARVIRSWSELTNDELMALAARAPPEIEDGHGGHA